MKKVLILGASGYIGSRLSLYLSQNEYLVTALVRKNFDFFKKKSWIDKIDNVIAGDIRDEEILSLLDKSSYETIINLISLNHNDSESLNPKTVNSVNFLPNWILLDKFSRKGLKNFIYFSTTQVYGNMTYGKFNENNSPNPLNIYGLTHSLSEEVCNFFNRKTNINCIVFRLSNSFGDPLFVDNKCWSLAINNFCQNAIKEGRIILKSDGKGLRDFIHYVDICGAVKFILNFNLKKSHNLIFNLSFGESMSIYDAAMLVKEIYREKFNESISIDLPDHSENNIISKSSRLIIDNSKLKDIGYIFKTNYKKHIYDLINFIKINNA